MMRWHYHFDLPSGLSGDMFLGACLDLGLPEARLAEALQALNLPGVGLEIRRARRGGITGTRFRVLQEGRPLEGPDPEEGTGEGQVRDGYAPVPHAHDPSGHAHSHAHEEPDPHGLRRDSGAGGEPPFTVGHAHGRSLGEIRELLRASALPKSVRERATLLFVRLGEAEAAVHGVPLDSVHFHEVGAVDSIVDLVGAAVAWEWLDAERITCGAVNVGSGTVRTQHGVLPVPAPATARLLAGVPVYGAGSGELLTPTGAVLLAELVDAYGDLPAMTVAASGYGLGKRELADRPNAARILRGSAAEPSPSEVMVVECEVDDLPGEGFGHLLERLLEGGALDAYFTPVQMKKSRPGVLVTALCRRERLDDVAGLLLLESGSLGCRWHAAARFEAERDSVHVETEYGAVRVKRARFRGRDLGAAPEYEDCRALALARGVPWREVYRAALVASGARR